MNKIMDVLEEIMNKEEEREVYLEGTSRFIGVPELSDINRLRELFHAFERKEKLLKLLDRSMEQEGINVIIGAETEVKEMRDMSIITSCYQIDRDASRGAGRDRPPSHELFKDNTHSALYGPGGNRPSQDYVRLEMNDKEKEKHGNTSGEHGKGKKEEHREPEHEEHKKKKKEGRSIEELKRVLAEKEKQIEELKRKDALPAGGI